MDWGYGPEGKYLWDMWFVKYLGFHHVFYLQAKKTRDREKRHDLATVGHAISPDLIDWKELPVALESGEKGAWDDLAIWTGTIYKKRNKFLMFYTGRNREKGNELIQKIGLATSEDLVSWKKYGKNPILEADEKFYYISNSRNNLNSPMAWRDPYIFKDKNSGKYYLFIAARKKSKKNIYNSCIAVAESKNLYDWKVLPPIFAPGKYDEIETPQMVCYKDKYYLFFSVSHEDKYNPTWAKKVGKHSGLHCYCSDELFGEYVPVNGNGVVVPNARHIYDIRLLRKKGKGFIAVGWRSDDEKGKFVGKMSLPFEIDIEGKTVYRVK